MRIVTWNMGYWGHASAHEAAWRWLLDELSPDIALLQECVVPSWVQSRATVLFDEAYPKSRNQRWGTALVTRDLTTIPARLEEIETWLATLGDHAPDVCSAARDCEAGVYQRMSRSRMVPRRWSSQSTILRFRSNALWLRVVI